MKRTNKLFAESKIQARLRRLAITVLWAVMGLAITGCSSLGMFVLGGSGSGGMGSSSISIKTDGNLSTVRTGGTLRFSAAGQGVGWTVSSTSDGTGPVAGGTSISSGGVLTVAANETLSVLYVIATSTYSGQSTYKQIRVTSVTNVTVNPVGQSVFRGRTFQFNAAVTGNNNPDNDVTWNVSSNTAGTGAVTPGTGIDANGLLTVARNETVTILYISAASVVDPSKSGSAAVTIIIPIVTGVGVGPANQSITSGRTLQFNAAVAGTNIPDNAVAWRVSSNAAGTGAVTSGTDIDANGLLTVAPNENTTILYVFATSAEDPSKSGSVIVSVIVPTVTGVAVSPANQSITRGRALQFNASVAGSNNPSNDVTWKVSSNIDGTGAVASGTNIDANGVLTVLANETATTLFVIASSVTDPAKSGSVIVNVIVPTVTGVAVSPANQSVNRGKTLQFSASVVGSNNPSNAVTWNVSSNAAGTGAVTSGTGINANGLLTVSANETAATLFVIASSVTDPARSGSVIVNVNINIPAEPVTPSVPAVTPSVPAVTPSAPPVTGVSISPSNPSVAVGSPLQLKATVTGTNNSSNNVTWKVSSNNDGTGAVGRGTSINNNGKLTISANETAAVLYVFATSVADPTKSGSIMVTVIRNNNRK